MKKLLSIFMFLSFIAFVSCEEGAIDDSSGNPNPGAGTGKYSILGAIQKGPFVQGSSITISELDDDLNPTGVNYQTTTTNDSGAFSIGSQINSRYVEITAEGYYFNEVSGSISTSTLTLRTISDLESSTSVNVNLLTSLANSTLKSIISDSQNNLSFEDALQLSENRVLSAFGISAASTHFDKMDITKEGDANAILLGISITLQSNNSVGVMSELLAKIGDELSQSEILTTQSLKTAIQTGAVGIDLEQVRNNLIARYATLNTACSIPEFENFVDSDGDGVIDSYQSWLLVKGDKSYPIDYTRQEVYVEIEQNIEYSIDINYDSESQGWIEYSKSPTVRSNIEYETITFTASEHSGYNSRVATITFKDPSNIELSSSITIEQSPKGALVLGKDSYDVKASGDVVEISFATNDTNYKVEVESSAEDWIEVTPTAKSITMEDYDMSFTISENTLSTSRSGRIYITAGDDSDYITINQSGQRRLYIEEEDIERGWTGGDVTITVVHNGDYEIDLQDNNSCWDEWSYSVVSTSDSKDVYNINMTSQSFLLPSTYGVYSSNTIKVTSKEDNTLTDEIFVEQWPYPRVFIDVGDSEQTLTSAQQDIAVVIYNNNSTIIDVDCEGDWIHLSSSQPKYSSSYYTEYTYSIDANSGMSRTGTITFSAPYTSGSGSVVSRVITITQTGDVQETLTVNCPAAGTLSSYVSELQIRSTTELILTGTVNADDFANVINLMPKLEILDMSDARFENDEMTAKILYLSSNNISSVLREIKLPSAYDTTLYGSSFAIYTFYGVCNLTHIDFGWKTR